MRSGIRTYLATILVLVCITGNLQAYSLDREVYTPQFKPKITIDKTSEKISIDGNLDESIWKSAVKITNFIERSPGENIPPQVKTYALATYDEDHLYVAFKCFDDPSKIRATMCQRDQFSSDDAVCVLLDTYGDAAWAYEFYVNPYGIQKDYLWTNVAGEDSGFDLIWESAAKINSEGYQVEIAIPFSSLRFPNNDIQSWKMDFWRTHPRESNRQYSWSAYDRNEQCFPCQWGTVEGISNVSPGKGYEILPTFLANQYGYRNQADDFENDDIDGELSLNGKFTLSSSTTLEATYNPDFSQIESDASQIDVNTTIALFYPERRPFFQEGTDIFRTLFNSFYTRTVNDPKFATKMTGRYENFTIGFVSALDENSPYMIPLEQRSLLFNTGESFVNVLRGTKELGNSSSVGFIVTDRRFEHNGSGSIYALDHRFRLSSTISFNGQYIFSHTKEPDEAGDTAPFLDVAPDGDGYKTVGFDGESYWGNALIAQIRHHARHLNVVLGVDQVSPSYRTQTGYDPVNNDRNMSSYVSYTIHPGEHSLFEWISPSISTYHRFNYAGTKTIENFGTGIQGRLRKAQSYWSVQYNYYFNEYASVDFNDLWNVNLDWQSRLNDQLAFGLSYETGIGYDRGSLSKADEKSLFAWLDLKPIDRLTIEPNINYYKSNMHSNGVELYDGFITRTRLQLQANKELSIRFVVEYNDFYKRWNIDPLLTYRISSFSVFYVGSSYQYDDYIVGPNDQINKQLTDRQFFMKLQYLFQI